MAQQKHNLSRARRVGAALGCLAVALLVLTLALPSFHASAHFLPVDAAIGRYFDERNLPASQLDALTQRASESIALEPHFRLYDGLSLLEYLQAIELQSRPWLQRPALFRSEQAALAAVNRAPANPAIWLRIAQIRAALGTPEEAVLAPLE